MRVYSAKGVFDGSGGSFECLGNLTDYDRDLPFLDYYDVEVEDEEDYELPPVPTRQPLRGGVSLVK